MADTILILTKQPRERTEDDLQILVKATEVVDFFKTLAEEQ
jgi:hypothetical protein